MILEYPDWLDMELWKEFQEMRKKKKKPMTRYAEHLRIKELRKIMNEGYSQEDIINQSVGSCWDQFYKPKGVQPKKPIHQVRSNPANEMLVLQKAFLILQQEGIKPFEDFCIAFRMSPQDKERVEFKYKLSKNIREDLNHSVNNLTDNMLRLA